MKINIWTKLVNGAQAFLKVFKRKRNKKLKITQKELQEFSSSESILNLIGDANSNDLIYVASRIADDLGYSVALRFAMRHASTNIQTNSAHILRANCYINDDDKWLGELNAYLYSFDLLPIKLDNRPGPRISRMLVENVPAIYSDMVSVIMSVFNASSTITYAVNSILLQTWKNLELIIVDDCSNDGTWEIIQALARSDKRIRLLRNKVNVGPYVSKNLALRVAKGKYITGQDADDWSHPQRIERDIHVIQKHNGRVRGVISCLLRMQPSGEFSKFARTGASSFDGASRVAAISLIIDAAYFRQHLGAWDSVRFGADGELIKRAKKIMGSSLVTVFNIGMIGLDLPGSLSNDLVHGVSVLTGKSKTRQEYTDAYQVWHSTITSTTAKLGFPQVNRLFSAPDVMGVPMHAIQVNIEAHEKQLF